MVFAFIESQSSCQIGTHTEEYGMSSISGNQRTPRFCQARLFSSAHYVVFSEHETPNNY
jgi:hypothetical protein